MNWWIDNELSAYDAGAPMARIERRTGGIRDMVEAGGSARLSATTRLVVGVHLLRCSSKSQPSHGGRSDEVVTLCHVAARGQHGLVPARRRVAAKRTVDAA